MRWDWRPLGTSSRYLRAAVIYAEDYHFYRHDSVDWDAIEHAVSADWNHGAMSPIRPHPDRPAPRPAARPELRRCAPRRTGSCELLQC